MAVSMQAIYNLVNEIAPFADAYTWDNSGWQIRLGGEAGNVMIALDLTDSVAEQAIQKKCDLIITHHPVLFDNIKKIDAQIPMHNRMIGLIQHGISVLSAHTCMDKANGGINDYLAEKLGLQNISILAEEYEGYVKIAVYVPGDYADKVMEAACGAGAGKMGNYSHCTFSTNGVGTFLPNGQANPFTGRAGELSRENEIKLEMICPKSLAGKVTDAIKNNHPYELPAMDIYDIKEPQDSKGTARIGYLEKEYSVEELAQHIKSTLGFETMRVSVNAGQRIRCMAICGGGGGSLISLAKKNGAHALLTGEIKHSDYAGRNEGDMVLMEAGHFDTELCFTEVLFTGLQQRLNALEWNVNVMKADERRPYVYV